MIVIARIALALAMSAFFPWPTTSDYIPVGVTFLRLLPSGGMVATHSVGVGHPLFLVVFGFLWLFYAIVLYVLTGLVQRLFTEEPE